MKANNPLPKVVLLGRTNAGKSTLFNRLTESNKAIVSPAENTTRDQNRGKVYWKGSVCELIDTGGLDTAAYDQLNQSIQQQVQSALQAAAAVMFVVDGKGELMPQDREVAQFLHTLNIPVLLCVNKLDNQRSGVIAEAQFAKLAFTPILCSAKNGSGTATLLDALFAVLPAYPVDQSAPDQKKPILLTLIGRPNVGKSSLFNALIGEERVIVSDLPHTTRDINDTELEYKGQLFVLLDTAGIRKKSQVGRWRTEGGTTTSAQRAKQLGVIEELSVQAAFKTIAQADVVVLLLEAHARLNTQDKTLIDYAASKGKGVLLVVNKWDLIPNKTASTIYEYKKYYGYHLEFASHIPVIFISALEKQRVTDVLEEASKVYANEFFQAPPETLDQILKTILQRQPKQQKKLIRGQPKKPLELITLDQIDVNPPTFRLVTSNPKNVAPAIINTIEKDIRRRCGYDGVPIIINVRNS